LLEKEMYKVISVSDPADAEFTARNNRGSYRLTGMLKDSTEQGPI